jgi:hypothetical protein
VLLEGGIAAITANPETLFKFLEGLLLATKYPPKRKTPKWANSLFLSCFAKYLSHWAFGFIE